MKKIILIYLLLSPAFFLRGQVFIGTKPTENPALLEVKSANRGILIPGIDIPDTLLATPVSKPQEGLFVMNSHAGKEGLFFWNGKAWEKLKTDESALADLAGIGKKNIFTGTEQTSGMPLAVNSYTDVPLNASMGTLTGDKKAHPISSDGVYEIAACFTGIPNQTSSFIILSIYNYAQHAALANTTIAQGSTYSDIAAKAIYCGSLKKGDTIGIRIYYGLTTSLNSNPEKMKTAILSIKKINQN